MKSISTQVARVIDIIGGAMFLAMILLTVFNRVSGWVVGRTFGQVEEIILAAFVWVSYVGMGELYGSGEHISVDLLVKTITPRARQLLRLFIDIIVLVVSAVIVYFAVILSLRSINKYTAVLKIRYFYIDLAVVIGFASTVIHAIRSIVSIVSSLARREMESR
jgi:TRAP-type C4-dicarboxylate transport system permease small subunit